MKSVFLFFLLNLIVFSCSIERKYAKERRERGNHLSFVYFKKSPVNELYSSASDIHSSDSFVYIYFGGQTEVSNNDYWRFLNYLKEKDAILFQEHRPKTENWSNYKKDFNFADSMAEHYDDLNLFGEYPVVNVTHIDAEAYIRWLNEIEPDSTVNYHFFSTEKWLEFFNKTPTVDSSFSWGGTYWRNSFDQPLGNYAEFDQNQIRYDQIDDQIHWYNADSVGYNSYVNGPMKCWSFNPNTYGGYNLSGNVAEMVGPFWKQKGQWHCMTLGGSWHSPVFYLRKLAEERYKIPSPYVGFRVLKLQVQRVKAPNVK